MPIYEYECTACHNVIEVFQRMTEDPLCTCPDCSGPLKKLVSISSFKLKGGGWYADGYSNNSSTCSKSAGKGNGKGNGKGGQKKSDKNSTAASKKSDSVKTSPSKKSSAAAA